MFVLQKKRVPAAKKNVPHRCAKKNVQARKGRRSLAAPMDGTAQPKAEPQPNQQQPEPEQGPTNSRADRQPAEEDDGESRTSGGILLRLQVASDLHLEYRPAATFEDLIVPSAPVLALLGDIGRVDDETKCAHLRKFLAAASAAFDAVLFVPGNHEYYHAAKDVPTRTTLSALRDACSAAGENVLLCERQELHINGVRLLATTLWSRIPKPFMREAWRMMQDFDHIAELNVAKGGEDDDGILAAWRAYNTLFETDAEWLRERLEAASDADTLVVLTHHAPTKDRSSPTGVEAWNGIGRCGCNATNMSANFSGPLAAWAFGHTHWNDDWVEAAHGVRLVSNQLGEPGETFGAIEDGTAVGVDNRPYDRALVREIKQCGEATVVRSVR